MRRAASLAFRIVRNVYGLDVEPVVMLAAGQVRALYARRNTMQKI
jgi:hypothetical protein